MSFNDQVGNLSAGGGRRSVFKEGVKSKNLTGDSPILMRIQPAYNYEDHDAAGGVNPQGWVTCRDANDNLTAWGGIVRMARFVGHGQGKSGNRRDFLSPLTWGDANDVFCPISVLYATAANHPEWQYLLQDRKDASGRTLDRQALGMPGEFLVMNIVELSGGAMPENVLGVATKSATDALVNPKKNGLLFWRANNVSEEQIAANPLCKWSIGDVTEPTNGPVLFVSKGTDKGKMSGYQVGLATDTNNQVRRYPIDGNLLAQRYDLADVRNVLEVKPDEAVVADVVTTFSQRGPGGYHEYELLKLAFSGLGFTIPDAPAAPAASSTVAVGGPVAPPMTPGAAPAGGFGPAPGSPPAAPPIAPPVGGIQAPPMAGAPAAPPMAPPVAPPMAPPAAPPMAPPAAPPVAAAPPAAPPVAAAPPAAAAPAPAVAPPVGAPVQPTVAPPVVPAAQAPGVDATLAANAAAPVQPGAPAAAAPAAPGDPVGGDWGGRDQFLQGLREQAGDGAGAPPPQ